MEAKAVKALEDEIRKLDNVYRWTLAIGVPVLIIVAVCSYRLQRNFKEIVLNPQNLAMYVAAEMGDRAPGFIDSVENRLIAEAPRIANEVSGKFEDLFPVIRESGKGSVDVLTSQVPLLRDAARNAVENYFLLHSADVRRQVTQSGKVGFARVLVDKVVTDVLRTKVLDEQYSLNDAHEAAYQLLKRVQSELDALAAKDSFHMTQAERLQRRFIAAWVSMFLQGFDIPVKTQTVAWNR